MPPGVILLRYSYYLTLPVAALFLAYSGQSGARAETRPLFASDETMAVTIEAPFTTLMRKRNNEELDGTFVYSDASNTEHKLDIKIRTRGRYRRQKDVCSFAPVRLNFRKKQVSGTVFAGQDKLKLVTHCSNWERSYEQLVLREYLSYRLLRLMTGRSFGVRLMRITYVDTDKKNKERTKYGFVIEDKDHVAERLGLEYASRPSVDQDDLNGAEASMVSVFQYMIGNTDFSMVRGASNDDCCHNVMLFAGDGGSITPVPYDFDFSGVVDAPYAGPNPKYPISTVTDRLYLGLCTNNALVEETIARFQARENDVRSLIDAQEGLSRHSRRAIRRFINEFYRDIGDSELVERKLIKRCALAEGQSPSGAASQR